MRRASLRVFMAVGLLLIVLAVGSSQAAAATQCYFDHYNYGTTYCNVLNWCWWYDGQLETQRQTVSRCTDDGGQTWYYQPGDWEWIEGNCCDVG